MTMTDTEAKALALVNEIAVERGGSPVDFYGLEGDIIATALCRVIEREAATEARHAAELREQAERFSEVAAKVDSYLSAISAGPTAQKLCEELAPFIIAKPDPLVDVMNEMGFGMSKTAAEEFRAAMQARGYEWRKIGEAGE